MKQVQDPKQANTIIELFECACAKWPDNPLLWEKTNSKYEALTYQQVREKVLALGAGLHALGVKKGDRIALLSEGRNYWLITELAILYAGAINVPLSTKLEGKEEVLFRLTHSDSRYVFVSRFQAAKVEAVSEKIPTLEKVIYFDECNSENDKGMAFSEVMAKGEELLGNNPATYYQIWKNTLPADYANICYTSGTTADPKGIILSHLNYAANTRQSNTLMTIDENYRTLALLPWDHSFAHTACLYSFIVNGASIASVQQGSTPLETLRNVPINIKEFKPDILMSVPALAKNFRKNIEKGIKEKGATSLFKKALAVSYKYQGDGWNKGRGWRAVYKPMVKLYDKLLYAKIRENFGGHLKFFVGGGALLDIELQRFFYAIGTPMCQGYGLSESSPVISSNSLEYIKFGSSGKLVKELEMSIRDENGSKLPVGEQGEIVIKGDNVMVGYWKNKEATDNTIKDGWLYTGDLGYMDKKGYLYVLGRYKSLLIANDGEKYSPEGIEEALVESTNLIEQIMLYNNQHPYTSALIVPNKAALLRFFKEKSLSIDTQEGQFAFLDAINFQINEFKTGGKYQDLFPERWLPTTFSLLNEPFSAQNGLINSTMKLVRPKVEKYFKDNIDFMYTTSGKEVKNQRNLETVVKFKYTDI